MDWVKFSHPLFYEEMVAYKTQLQNALKPH